MRSSKIPARILAVGLSQLLLLGCAVQDVRQLDRYKEWANKGDDASIVADPVDCDTGDSGCDQLRLIRGMSCYREGKKGVDPENRFDCAIDELGEGLKEAEAQGQPPTERKPYAQALLESIRERGDLSSSWSESEPYTTILKARSDTFRATFPDSQDGFYYGATARLLEANRLLETGRSPSQPCNLLSQSQQLLTEGKRRAGNLSENLTLTARQVDRLLRQECAT